MVVYLGDTSETHWLPTALAALLPRPVTVVTVDELDELEQEPDGRYRLSAQVVDELLRLQILVAD